MGKNIKHEPEHLQPVKVEHVADCSDCGKPDVVNRRVCYNLVDMPYTHWRKKCNECKRYNHPITDEWLAVTAFELNRLCQEKRLTGSELVRLRQEKRKSKQLE